MNKILFGSQTESGPYVRRKKKKSQLEISDFNFVSFFMWFSHVHCMFIQISYSINTCMRSPESLNIPMFSNAQRMILYVNMGGRSLSFKKVNVNMNYWRKIYRKFSMNLGGLFFIIKLFDVEFCLKKNVCVFIYCMCVCVCVFVFDL